MQLKKKIGMVFGKLIETLSLDCNFLSLFFRPGRKVVEFFGLGSYPGFLYFSRLYAVFL